MNNQGALILHNAGVVKRIVQRETFSLADPTKKHVYFLKKGLIKISCIHDDKEEIIKYFIKPGSIFGELNLFDSEDENEVAEAVEDCEVCFIPAETAKQFMLTNHELQKAIHHAISRRIKKTEERMFSLMTKSVTDRVRGFLTDFAKEFGQPVTGGLSVKKFLTHDDIARLTTTSRQSVSKALACLKKKGIIDYNAKMLFVSGLLYSDK
jgi:CRP/FNR family transcriptional regulator